MKKNFLGIIALTAVFAANPLQAQQQGDMVITGSLGLSGNSTHYRSKVVQGNETSKEKEIVPGSFKFSA